MSPFAHNKKLGGRFMGLFTGTHGSGKTVAIGSMPGPILIFDFDGRIDPITLFYPDRTDIEYFTVGLSGKPRGDVIGFLDFCERMERLQDRCDYGTVAIDSYTMYSTVAVLHQMGIRDEDTLKKTKGGLPIPDWDEFKGETGVAVQIMEIAKIIPAHFIMTAHPVSKAATTKQGGSTNETLASMVRTSTLATYGWKTVSILPSYFNEMYYFYTDVNPQLGQISQRKIQTVSAGEIVAKTALPLPATLDVTGKPFWGVMQAQVAEYTKKLEAAREAKAAAAGGAK
jgi:hypothetical protein